MDLSGIHEVEDLHHHESIEDESEMTRVIMRLVEDDRVIISSRGSVETTTTDSTTNDTPVPLVLGVGHVQGLIIKGVPLLRDEGLAHKDEDEEEGGLEDGLTDDVLLHGGRNDIIVTGMGLSKKKTLIWVFSSQCKGG